MLKYSFPRDFPRFSQPIFKNSQRNVCLCISSTPVHKLFDPNICREKTEFMNHFFDESVHRHVLCQIIKNHLFIFIEKVTENTDHISWFP